MLNRNIKLLRVVNPPRKASTEAAGFDLHTPFNFKAFSNMPPIEVDEDNAPSTALPNDRLPLGISSEFSPGYVGLILPRSSLGSKEGLHPRNICGVIDSDYRGEWQAAVRVDSEQGAVTHKKNDAVFQVLFLPIAEANEYELTYADGFVEMGHDAMAGAVVRGEGGFGSTS